MTSCEQSETKLHYFLGMDCSINIRRLKCDSSHIPPKPANTCTHEHPRSVNRRSLPRGNRGGGMLRGHAAAHRERRQPVLSRFKFAAVALDWHGAVCDKYFLRASHQPGPGR